MTRFSLPHWLRHPLTSLWIQTHRGRVLNPAAADRADFKALGLV